MNKKIACGLLVVISAVPFVVFAQRDIACSITTTPSRAAPGEQVTLRWNSQNARSATLAGFGPVPLSGSRVIQATQTTDYKIMVSGYENNYVGCIARLSVVAKQPACNISLVPFAVASNNFATLSWSTDYADSVYISGIGTVQPKGNQMVRATGNTTYTLSARGAGGVCERSTELTVRDQYQSYGYFPQTVQNITYPLFGYSNNTTAKSSPSTYSPSFYSQNQYQSYDTYETYWYKGDDVLYDSGEYDKYYGDTEYAPYWNTPPSETYIEKYDVPQYEVPQYQEPEQSIWNDPYMDDGVYRTYEEYTPPQVYEI